MSISRPWPARPLSANAEVFGPVGQGEFLLELGILQRAEALKSLATPEQAAAIDAALARLTGDQAKAKWAACSRCWR